MDKGNSYNEIYTEPILGYRVSLASKERCVGKILSWLEKSGESKYFVCANPHSLIIAGNDRVFHNAIFAADLVIPDGIGVVLVSRLLGGNIRQRITGSDIFFEVSKILNERKNIGYFFLGSTQETLAKIKEKLARDFPNIRYAGGYSPPFKEEFDEEEDLQIIKAIDQARPEVLWVGMTAPKQEKWIYRNLSKINVKFIGAVGAVFDFYTGNVKRPNLIFQKAGLEWLPRFIRQPKRLWRRNLVSTPRFLFRVARDRLLIQW